MPVLVLALVGCKTTAPVDSATPVEALDGTVDEPDSPFLLALGSTQRTSILEQLSGTDSGLPVFQRIEVDGKLVLNHLEKCKYPAEIIFKNRDSEGFAVLGRSDVEVMANASAGRFSAGVIRAQAYTALVKTAGSWQARDEPQTFPAQSLNDDNQCDSATHVGKRIWAGSFDVAATRTQTNTASLRIDTLATLAFDNERFESTSIYAGKLPACTDEPKPGLPVSGCGQPVRVELEPLVRPERFDYYFDDSSIRSERPRDRSLTNDELARVGDQLHKALTDYGKELGYSVHALEKFDPDVGTCWVSAAPDPSKYILNCGQAPQPKAQTETDRSVSALASAAPSVARQFIPDPGRSGRKPAGRLVVLMDVSTSMLVNDPETYISDDVSYSYRYELTDLLLHTLMDLDINVDVALVSFSGPGPECTKPVLVDDKVLWPLSEDTSAIALNELKHRLLDGPRCKMDGTDIAAPLAAASELLGSASKTGGDVVLLVTDGAHTTQTGQRSPKVEGRALIAAGAHLNLVRVYQADLEELRKEFASRRRDAVIKRWAWLRLHSIDEIAMARARAMHEQWMIDLSADNEEGEALLKDLSDLAVESAELNLGPNRTQALATVHNTLLPQFGAIVPFSMSRCGPPELEQRAGAEPLVRMVCDINISPGKTLSPSLTKPKCMGKVRKVALESGNNVRRTLDILEETPTNIYIQGFEFGDRGGSQPPIAAELTVTAPLNPDYPRCD